MKYKNKWPLEVNILAEKLRTTNEDIIYYTKTLEDRINKIRNMRINNTKLMTIGLSTPGSSIENRKFSKTHTFYTPSYISFFITAIAIEGFIKQHSTDCVTSDRDGHLITQGYEHDYGDTRSILTNGKVVFVYEGNLFEYSLSIDHLNVKISFNDDGESLLKRLNSEISEGSNFLKNKHVYLYQTDNGIAWKIKKAPTMRWEDLIMKEDLKEAIYDATILHMKLLEINGGSIMHGVQGSGKSFICQALIAEALLENFSTCHLTSAVNFEQLDELLIKYLSPCLVIIEDIDSFAQDREIYENTGLSNFLQFLSGVTEKEGNVNIIATTNYLKKIDKAISDRPMRFNQKFLIDYLSNEEKNKIFNFYFKNLTEKQKLLYEAINNKNISASHISAIYERYTFLLKKKELLKINEEDEETLNKSINHVLDNFDTKKKKQVGFS